MNYMTLIEALLADPAKATGVSQEDARALLVALAPVQKALELQALRPVEARENKPPRLLTLPEVAERSRKSKRWWQEHWRAELGAVAVKKGKPVLIPEDALDAWLGRT